MAIDQEIKEFKSVIRSIGPVNKRDYNAIKSDIIKKLTPTESLEYTFYIVENKNRQNPQLNFH